DPEVKKELPDEARQGIKQGTPKVRTFLFTYAATVKGLEPGKKARIWLPVAATGPDQEVTIAAKDLPADGTLNKDKTYGNNILYVEGKANADGQVPLQVTYRVRRREVKTDPKAAAFLKPGAAENLERFLQPDAKVPLSGKPLELIKDKDLKGDQLDAAKVIYDVVNGHMEYKKVGTGWGQGDAVWACDSKYGNCSDFHSLFIALTRSQKIPSKFEMGFPLPPKRGAGPIGGYHCWAWFLPNGKGWVPVDISEANQHPQMKDYYFGNLTEDRVQ